MAVAHLISPTPLLLLTPAELLEWQELCRQNPSETVENCLQRVRMKAMSRESADEPVKYETCDHVAGVKRKRATRETGDHVAGVKRKPVVAQDTDGEQEGMLVVLGAIKAAHGRARERVNVGGGDAGKYQKILNRMESGTRVRSGAWYRGSEFGTADPDVNKEGL